MRYRLAAQDTGGPIGVDTETRVEDPFHEIRGESETLGQMVETARRMARRGGANILLIGETGTGKEIFARAIHAAGRNSEAPFVAVNCAAIPGSLLESELFGYERGAFTDAQKKKKGLLELAQNGTLFLDEVASMPADLQPKLLRALEERRVRRVGGFDEVEIRCRVTAATNEPLEKLVDEGQFREDLFYRLNVLRIEIPPLRERAGDVRLLAEHFLGEVSTAQGLPPARLTDEARAALEAHGWPGNVRELKNVIERALVVSEGGLIGLDQLAIESRRVHEAVAQPQEVRTIEVPAGGRSLESVEAELVRHTLELTEGNKSAAARVLGISRPTLHRKIDRYRLELSA